MLALHYKLKQIHTKIYTFIFSCNLVITKKVLPIESNTINNNIDDGKGNIYVVCNLRNNIVYIYNI